LKPTGAWASTQFDTYGSVLDALLYPALIKRCDLSYQLCNRAFAELWGLSMQSISGKTDLDFWPPEEVTRLKQEDLQILASEQPMSREIGRLSGDSTQWFELSKSPLKNEHGTVIGLLCVMRDITQVKKVAAGTQWAVVERDRYRGMLENLLVATSEMVALKDVDSVYLDCSEAYCTLLGQQKTEVVGKTDFDVWSARDALVFHEEEVQVVSSGVSLVNEHLLETSCGTRWFEIVRTPLFAGDGGIIGILVIVRDLTGDKWPEDKRNTERDFIAKVLDMVEAPVIVWNSVGRIVLVNRKSRELFGYEDEDLCGKVIWDYLPSDEIDWMLKALLACNRNEVLPFHETTFRGSNGKAIPLLWNNCVLREESVGEAVFIGSGLDLSDLVTHEQAIERRNRELHILYAALRAANSALDPAEIYRKVSRVLMEIGDYPVVSAAIKQGVDWHVVFRGGFSVSRPGINALAGVTGRTIRSGQAQFVRDVLNDPDYIEVGTGVTCEICVPVTLDGSVVGTLNIESTADRPLTDDDFKLLQALANQMSLVMTNALLNQNLAAERDYVSSVNKQLLALHGAVTGISAYLELQELLDAIPCRAMELVGGTSSCVLLLNDQNELELRSMCKQNCGQACLQKSRCVADAFTGPVWESVVASGRLLVSGNVRSDTRFPAGFSRLCRAVSIVSVPLVIGKAVIGLLSVCHDSQYDAFDENDVNILSLLGNQAATVLENARLYAATTESEQRYRSLFDGNLEGILLVDASTGQIIETNRAFQDMLGYAPAELAGREIWDLHLLTRRDRAYRDWAEGIRQGQSRGRMVPFVAKDGHVVEAEFSSRIITLGSRTLEVRSVRDVTETVRLQEHLRQSQKLEAVGTLAGGIAHDFNNILGSILGYALYLRGTMDVDDVRRNDLDVIAQSVHRGSDLITQLLTFARGELQQRREIDLNKVVQEVILLLSRTVDKSIVIRPLLDENLEIIIGDRSQLQQVVMNLCLNACDAMSAGGTLTIRTETIDPDTPQGYQELDRKAGTYVQLSVSDTGHGMDSETMERMFEPFFSTKRGRSQGQHNGLGLATVFGIVRGHDGTIRAESVVGQGTVFRVWLPAARHQADGVDADDGEAEQNAVSLEAGQGELVLVVEDEDHIRDLLCRILERNAYRVVAAEDGIQALVWFEEHAAEVDLVILDMVMPRMSGMRTYLRMREIDPSVNVVMVSGNTEQRLADEMMNMGVSGYLRKPFTLQQVLSEVRKALDEKE